MNVLILEYQILRIVLRWHHGLLRWTNYNLLIMNLYDITKFLCVMKRKVNLYTVTYVSRFSSRQDQQRKLQFFVEEKACNTPCRTLIQTLFPSLHYYDKYLVNATQMYSLYDGDKISTWLALSLNYMKHCRMI